MAVELSIEDRRKQVVQLLEQQGFMTLSSLARQFDVSESTLRRDLELLDEQGQIQRTRGGAVYVRDSSQHPLAFTERESTAQAEKAAIARTVAELVEPEQTLILNGGTTCFQVARELAGRRLSVITNSVPIAAVLMGEQETEVTMVGGYLYPRTGVALGEKALTMLEQVHADVLVFSCAGVTDGWAFNTNDMMVEVERRMMQIAGQKILAVDHNKLGRKALARLCELRAVDVVVTDAGADDEQIEQLRASGPGRVIRADR